MRNHGFSGRRRSRPIVAVLAALPLLPWATPAPGPAVAATPPRAAAQATGDVELISVATTGASGNGGSYLAPHPRSQDGLGQQMTPDGRYVAFESTASDLVDGDTNGARDVFVRDRLAGTTVRVNVTADGAQASNQPYLEDGTGAGAHPSISADGRYVSFTSNSPELRPGVDSDGSDIYVKDLQSGRLDLITTAREFDGGVNHGRGSHISSNGRFVAFSGTGRWATDAVRSGIYRYDVAGDTFAYVSDPQQRGCNASGDHAYGPRMSTDGSVVVFGGHQCNPTFPDEHLHRDLVWAWTGSGAPAMASIDENGDPVPAGAYAYTISADGRYLVFHDGRHIGQGVVYLRDLQAGTTELVSIAPDGTPFTDNVERPGVSADGRFVTFTVTEQSDTVTYIRDRQLGITEAVAGAELLTADGCRMAFTSTRLDLVAEDSNSSSDVYFTTGGPSWCGPSRAATFNGSIFDGHSRLDKHSSGIDGARVELRRNGNIVHGPVATRFGDFSFDGVAPGRYRVRVTLTDQANDEPVFDVRHGYRATEPVWAEFPLRVNEGDQVVTEDYLFSRAGDPVAVSADVPDKRWGRLDDMAVLFRNLKAFTRWVPDALGWQLASDDFPAPVETHAYSSLLSNNAGYIAGGPGSRIRTALHISPEFSGYQQRDGIGDDVGPIVEWHEFTHHLDRVNIPRVFGGDTYADACGDSRNHHGYLNPSTCDSVIEGLAAVLPTLFRNHRDSTTSSVYPAVNTALESNGLTAFTGQYYERNGRRRFTSREEFGYAALLWDLIDAYDVNDSKVPEIMGADVKERPVVLRDEVEVDVKSLLRIISSAGAATVYDIRAALFAADDVPADLKRISMDLDGDAIADIAPLDVPFVMHGFYPVESFEARRNHHHYFVEAWRNWEVTTPDGDRNRAVGWTNSPHPETRALRVDRHFTPRAPNSYVRLRATDRAGNRVSGVTVTVALKAPEGTESFQVDLKRGGNRVYLELPPHFTGLLGEDQKMPGCAGADHDFTVRIRASLAGKRSDNVIRFDNCEFVRAVAASDKTPAQKPLVMPPVPTEVTTKVRKRPRRVVVRGVLEPAVPDGAVTVKLQRRQAKRWKTVRAKTRPLRGAVDTDGDGLIESRYRGRMKRAATGRCRVVTVFKGDAGHRRSRDASRFRC